MRKVNAVLSAVILALCLIHGVLGAFRLLGGDNDVAKGLAWAAVVLIVIHAYIGIRLTAQTVRVWKATGVPYFRQNALFWARRISGFALMILLGLHVTAFGHTTAQGFRLQMFDRMKLMTQILLVLSMAVHVISNVRPMMIGLGIRSLKEHAGEILAVLSVLLFFMAAALVVYYLRWNSF